MACADRAEDEAGEDVRERGGPTGADDAVDGEAEVPADEKRREEHVGGEAADRDGAHEVRAALPGEGTAQHGGEDGEEAVREEDVVVGDLGGEDVGLGVEEPQDEVADGDREDEVGQGAEREQERRVEGRARADVVAVAVAAREDRAGVAEGRDGEGGDGDGQHRAGERGMEGLRRGAGEKPVRDESVQRKGELGAGERQGEELEGEEAFHGWESSCARQARIVMPKRRLKSRLR